MEPTSNPAFLNASGMANIPVPIFPFNRCIIVSQFLNSIWMTIEIYAGINSLTLITKLVG